MAFVDAVGVAFCRSRSRCAASFASGPTAAECEHRATLDSSILPRFSVLTRLARDGVQLDPAESARCLAAAEERCQRSDTFGRSDGVATWWRVLDACRAAMRPCGASVECLADWECPSDHYCDRRTVCEPGVCRPGVPLGAPCERDAECLPTGRDDEIAGCGSDARCTAYVLVDGRLVGEACGPGERDAEGRLIVGGCSPGAVCACPDREEGCHCRPMGGLGAPCDLDELCEPDLLCDDYTGSAGSGRCIDRASIDGRSPCSALLCDGTTSYVCGADDRCMPAEGTEGARCLYFEHCNRGLYCGAPHGGPHGQCRALLESGAPCESLLQCQSGCCRAGRCA
ncbi:MAG: hypothetical protein KF729_00010 [Sandaracinaceae bacterium]|nr:hypothetical protein [Sandaracinaceae bacterium]